MPTILAHPFVALAFKPTFERAKIPPSIFIVAALCCVLPDADVIGFKVGIPYNSTFGHRGFTHSVFFAVLVATVVSWLYSRVQRRSFTIWPVFALIFLSTVSHPLLDALTSGGEGVALLAPFSNERYFFPCRPVRVSPIGISRFMSGQANHLLLSELKWVVAPCVVVWLLTKRLVLQKNA